MRPLVLPLARHDVGLCYLFDRVEVSGRAFVGPAPAGGRGGLLAAFDRPSEPVRFSLLGVWRCEFPSGPNLAALASVAAELAGPGFYGLASARRVGFGDVVDQPRPVRAHGSVAACSAP